MESLEEIKIIKEKIIKTDHVLRMYVDVKSKYSELIKKYKQSIDDNSILKLDHEMKTFQNVEQSKQIERLNSEREMFSNQYSSMKVSYDNQLEELAKLQMKYQTVCQDFDDYQKSETKSDISNSEKKRKKLGKKQKAIEKCDDSGVDDSPSDKMNKCDRLTNIPSGQEKNTIKIEVLGSDYDVERPLHNFQISLKQEQLSQVEHFDKSLLEQLKKCQEEKSVYIQNSEEREMRMRKEWQEEEQKLKRKIDELGENIQQEKTLVRNFEKKEVEMKKKWEEKEKILKAKIKDLEMKIQEEKSLVKNFENTISHLKSEWIEKERMLKIELKVMKERLEKEKSNSLRNLEADMKVNWLEREQELKMKISHLEENIISLQNKERCKETLTDSFDQDDPIKNKYIPESKLLDLDTRQYDDPECAENETTKEEPLMHDKKEAPMQDTIALCPEQDEDSISDDTIKKILEEMRFTNMISPIPEEVPTVAKKASTPPAHQPVLSIPIISSPVESKQEVVAKDITLSPAPTQDTTMDDVEESISRQLETNQDVVAKDIMLLPALTGDPIVNATEEFNETTTENNVDSLAPDRTKNIVSLKDTDDSTYRIQKESEWSDRYKINRRKKESKYHILSKIKKAKQKFWLGLGQSFIFNKNDQKQSEKPKRKVVDRNGLTPTIPTEMSVGSNNTLVNGIATVFADLVSQKLNHSRSRSRTTNEKNVLEINKMLLEKAKQEKETKHLFKIESSQVQLPSSCDEVLLKKNVVEAETKESDINTAEYNESETHSSGIDTPNFVDSCYESIISNPPSIQSDSKDNMVEDNKGNTELGPQCNGSPKYNEDLVPVDKKDVEIIFNGNKCDTNDLAEIETKPNHIENVQSHDDIKLNSSSNVNDIETQIENLNSRDEQKRTKGRWPRKKKLNLESPTSSPVKSKRMRKSVEMPTQKYNLRNRTKTKEHLNSNEKQLDICSNDTKGIQLNGIDKTATFDTSNSVGITEHHLGTENDDIKSQIFPLVVEFHSKDNVCLKSEEVADDNSINHNIGVETSTTNKSSENADISALTIQTPLEIKTKAVDDTRNEGCLESPKEKEIVEEYSASEVFHIVHGYPKNMENSSETKNETTQSKLADEQPEEQNETYSEPNKRKDIIPISDSGGKDSTINSIDMDFHMGENSLNDSIEIGEKSIDILNISLDSELFPIPQELQYLSKSDIESGSDEEIEMCSEVNSINGDDEEIDPNHDEEEHNISEIAMKEVITSNNSFETDNAVKLEYTSKPQEELEHKPSEIHLKPPKENIDIIEASKCPPEMKFNLSRTDSIQIPQELQGFKKTELNLKSDEEKKIEPMEIGTLDSEFKWNSLKSELVGIPPELRDTRSEIYTESKDEEIDECHDNKAQNSNVIDGNSKSFQMKISPLDTSSENIFNPQESKIDFSKPEFECLSNSLSETNLNLSGNIYDEVKLFKSTPKDCSKTMRNYSGTEYESVKTENEKNNSLKLEFTNIFGDLSDLEDDSPEMKYDVLKFEFESTPETEYKSTKSECTINNIPGTTGGMSVHEERLRQNGEISFVFKQEKNNDDLSGKCNEQNSFNEKLDASTSNSSCRNLETTTNCFGNENISLKSEVSLNAKQVQYDAGTCLDLKRNMNTCNNDINVDYNGLNCTNDSGDIESPTESRKNIPKTKKGSVKSEITLKAPKKKQPKKSTLMTRTIKIYKLKSSAVTANPNIEMESLSNCQESIPVLSNKSNDGEGQNSSCGSTQRKPRRKSPHTAPKNMLKCLEESPSTINSTPVKNILENNSLPKKELSPMEPANTNTLKRKRILKRRINDTVSECVIPNVQSGTNSGNSISTPNLEMNKRPCLQRKKEPSQLEASKINIIQDVILKSKNKNIEQKTGGFKRPIINKIIPSCPESPPLPSVEETASYIEPLIIPLDKPTKMNPDKAGSLFRKLITYSTEEKSVEEVARNFCNQEVDYIASLILEQVIQDKEKPDAKVPRAPLMTHTQRVMLGFMLKLEKMNVCNLIDTYLKTTELYLIKADAPEAIESSTRLYVAICKSHGYIERIRRFCLDAFYFMGDFAIPFLFTVLISWIEVFPPAKDSESFPLIKVLIQLVNLKTCNKPGYNLLPLRELLHKFYEYPNEYTNTDNFFQELFNNYLRNPVAPSDFAILLYCKNNECKWVRQKIDTLIKPILPHIKNDNFKATLIILIGNIVNQFNGKLNSEYVIPLRDWLKDMTKEEDVPEIVKRSVMYAIHKLPKTSKKSRNKNVVEKNVQIVNNSSM